MQFAMELVGSLTHGTRLFLRCSDLFSCRYTVFRVISAQMMYISSRCSQSFFLQPVLQIVYDRFPTGNSHRLSWMIYRHRSLGANSRLFLMNSQVCRRLWRCPYRVRIHVLPSQHVFFRRNSTKHQLSHLTQRRTAIGVLPSPLTPPRAPRVPEAVLAQSRPEASRDAARPTSSSRVRRLGCRRPDPAFENGMGCAKINKYDRCLEEGLQHAPDAHRSKL